MPTFSTTQYARSVPLLWAKEEISLARTVGKIIRMSDRGWLFRVYLSRDCETNERSYYWADSLECLLLP
jgi:hypothetical protein